ncbi:MAG: TRAP transporter large permease [Granulosicoccus sp.]
MANPEIGLLSLLAILLLIFAGLWVPFALMLVSYLGVWAIKGSPLLASKLLALTAADSLSNYFFSVVPLFILMGYVVSATGLARDAFDIAQLVFRRCRGGLGVATVGANAVFSAVTGISIAAAAVFTQIAVPEMVRHGYTTRFSVGVVAGSSVLGMLIPPSLLLILYGLLTEQSIGDLFIAGIVPGLLLALVFALGVVFMTICFPAFTGSGSMKSPIDPEPLSTGFIIIRLAPICSVVVVVFGGIYSGFFTPTEAGAVGCLVSLIIGALRKRLSWQDIKSVLRDTGLVTASVCFLIISAQMYSRMLSLSGLPAEIGNFLTSSGLSYWSTIVAYIGVLILLGAILDSASIMLIMVPLMLPMMLGLDVNLIWFGIVTVLAVEIGLLTPPFGLAVFVIKNTLQDPSISLADIFWGAAPFALLMLFVLFLIIAMPWLVTGML